MLASVSDSVVRATDAVVDRWRGGTNLDRAALAAGGVASALTAGYLVKAVVGGRSKPSTYQLSGGSIEKGQVRGKFDEYWGSFGQGAGEGIVSEKRDETPSLVDTFYSLVTDIYEWGWGQSFHFSPVLPGQTDLCSEVAHEVYIPAMLHVGPGDRILDCGCGVGGPMRRVASRSGAHVTGITINDYQVQRAIAHNKALGVDKLTDVVCGNFLEMPFDDNTFDGAYAVEATCHSPDIQAVYAEIFRVIKPGSHFFSYEWVTTKEFDQSNPEHVRIIDEINKGNGLPEMRSYKECEEAGKRAGFELVKSIDFAVASPVCKPWYARLQTLNGPQIKIINRGFVNTLNAIGLLPRGVKEVHDMLVDVGESLVEGGVTGIFSPMHILLFRKPTK
ncbi:unnamed protein product [Pedinophyceae sp. YPF-701]|nr:unnamed protein product [Pedinophyceae sp. YPF-701]